MSCLQFDTSKYSFSLKEIVNNEIIVPIPKHLSIRHRPLDFLRGGEGGWGLGSFRKNIWGPDFCQKK